MGLIKCFENVNWLEEEEKDNYISKSKQYQSEGLNEKQADRKVLKEMREEIDNDLNTLRKALNLPILKRESTDDSKKEELRKNYLEDVEKLNIEEKEKDKAPIKDVVEVPKIEKTNPKIEEIEKQCEGSSGSGLTQNPGDIDPNEVLEFF